MRYMVFPVLIYLAVFAALMLRSHWAKKRTLVQTAKNFGWAILAGVVTAVVVAAIVLFN